MGEHRIVKIVKPIDALSRAAVATAPFVLPRLPVKVNQYWTFQAAAGDSPTFPVVAFQLYAVQIYDEFIRLLEKVSPKQAGKLVRDVDTAITARGVVRLIRDIRQIFENDPLIAGKMLEELERGNPDIRGKNNNEVKVLKSLVNMYGGSNHRHLNFYGPPRTLTTMPYHEALRLGEKSGKRERHRFQG